MKTMLKSILKTITGNQNITTSKLGISSLFTACILLSFTVLFQDNFADIQLFTTGSTIFFILWIIFTKGANSLDNIANELIRLIVFFTILINSVNFFIKHQRYNGFQLYLYYILSCIGLFLCSYYLVSKLSDIFDFIKNIFIMIKTKIFNSNKPATTKGKALIENITAFLVSIGALTIAFKTITDSIFQILEYFK